MSWESVWIGFGLGFFVALQLGPMSLFLIRLADGIAGLGLTTFGGVLGWRTLNRSG